MSVCSVQQADEEIDSGVGPGKRGIDYKLRKKMYKLLVFESCTHTIPSGIKGKDRWNQPYYYAKKIGIKVCIRILYKYNLAVIIRIE